MAGARADDVTATLKVALPLVIVAADGDTASQLEPDAIVTVGVMVTPPGHVPLIPIVKLCDARPGFEPWLARKAIRATEGACNVQGWVVSGTLTTTLIDTCRLPPFEVIFSAADCGPAVRLVVSTVTLTMFGRAPG